MPSVLFICTGNTCRSPMAMAFFKRQTATRGELGQWEMDSAGTLAVEGQPASEGAMYAMNHKGIDLRGHRSKPVTAELIDRHQLILVMEKDHQVGLEKRFGDLDGRVHLLSDMVGEDFEISDPYECSQEEYLELADRIQDLLRRGSDRIAELAR